MHFLNLPCVLHPLPSHLPLFDHHNSWTSGQKIVSMPSSVVNKELWNIRRVALSGRQAIVMLAVKYVKLDVHVTRA
jgi:hypothetical protein